ncbi:MAG: DUF45 domain-containing protein, partial [Gammaproteobacteria bacterium]|nr:DUF45 domain-containing protein [Gammaproteobacteria bacterium]
MAPTSPRRSRSRRARASRTCSSCAARATSGTRSTRKSSPSGRVTLVAPKGTRPEVARAYAISKLGWIREQQLKLKKQARETPRRFIERESHYLWGRRYLLSVEAREIKPFVCLNHKRITLSVRPGSDQVKRAEVIHEWHKSLLHEVVP